MGVYILMEKLDNGSFGNITGILYSVVHVIMWVMVIDDGYDEISIPILYFPFQNESFVQVN